MQFSIHISVARGATPAKFNVPSVPAVVAGVWSEPDKDILRPETVTILDNIPHRLRVAFLKSGGNFWFDNRNRWDGKCLTGHTPYCKLYDRRGKWLADIYAIPCAGGPPRRMVAADLMSMSDTAARWAWRR